MSPYIDPWVNLTDFAGNFDDDSELMRLMSEGLISLRGRFVDEGDNRNHPLPRYR
jgi:hypothetical protein